jgi:hypothetical protein
MIGVLHRKGRPYWTQMERTVREPFQLFTTELDVVHGSAEAMRVIAKSEAPWVLLQDDLLMVKGWLQLLQDKEKELENPNLGLIAGIDVYRNPKLKRRGYVTWATAQVQYFTAAGLAAVQKLLDAPPADTRHWDSYVCQAMAQAGLQVYLMPKYVCEHIGLDSAVHVGKRWAPSEKVVSSDDDEVKQ